MSDQELRGGFFPSEDQYIDENRVMESRGTADYGPIISDQLSSWLQNAPTFPSNSIEEAHEVYSNMLNGLSSFEVPSPLPSEQMNPGQISHSEKIILSGLEKGQSSGPKRTCASDSMEMQTKETDLQEDSAKEDPQTSDGCKPQKRTRSAEVHNLNERLRRQKHREKMKALRELIPNSNKRDKASTMDDAIKYIKTLQHQVQEHQMMRIGANYSTFQSPLTMMQQPGQQEMQVPNTLPSCLQICPPRDGRTTGMEYEIGMGTSGMFNFPMSQLGLPNNPCLLPSSTATSGLPAPDGISTATAHSIQNPENVLEALLYATSFPSSESQSTTRGESSSSQGAK